MTTAPRTAGRVFRKIAAALVLVPLAIVIVAFAVANRQDVTVSLDPFDAAQSAYATTTWLFVPIFAALIVGVVIGGIAAWLRHGGWRRTAQRLERERDHLRAEIDVHRRAAGASADASEPPKPPDRLKLRAPVR